MPSSTLAHPQHAASRRTGAVRRALLAAGLGLVTALGCSGVADAAQTPRTKAPTAMYAGTKFVPGSCIGSTMGFEEPLIYANHGDWFALYNVLYTDGGGTTVNGPFYIRMMQGGNWGWLDRYGNPTNVRWLASLRYGEGNNYGAQYLYDYQTGQWLIERVTPACPYV